MDPITDLLATTRVERALYARLDVGAPWGVEFAAGETARFGLVVAGECLFTIGGGETVRLHVGDCFVVPHGAGFRLQDDKASPLLSCKETVRDHIGESVKLGGTGSRASIVAGWFRLEPASGKPLLDILPSHLVCRLDTDRVKVLPALLELLRIETDNPSLGTELVVSRLVDIVLVQTLRFHAANSKHSGWLGALFDHKIGTGLRAMHDELGRRWTVDALARMCGMSRSSFAAAFKTRVGSTPLDYLTQWRMHRAGVLLRETEQSISSITYLIGYASEPSFIRTFKRRMGTTPATYRSVFRGITLSDSGSLNRGSSPNKMI
ncbi:MAG: AraC family transcriptional regulator [Rhodothermales bacterium]